MSQNKQDDFEFLPAAAPYILAALILILGGSALYNYFRLLR